MGREENPMSKHLSPEIRVPIEADNPSILRLEDLCVKCGRCRDICRDYVSVAGYYDLAKTNDKALCIHCGQCANVCPVGSITEKKEYQSIQEAMKDPDKVVIISTSPSVRVGLGEAFGMPRGSFVQGKMIAMLRKLGFDYVLDTNFAADLTIMEEAAELIERITKHTAPLPQFTSCCPAWVKFAETWYPELLPNISSVKSPIGMQGPTIKTYFAKKMGIDPAKIVNVALTPCTAKKYEIRRDEMSDASKYLGIPGMRDMDYVITTREAAQWAQEEGIDFLSLEDSDYDPLMGEGSGAGVIFGNTGGVMEAAIRTAYKDITGQNAPDSLLDLEPVRGMDGMRDATVKINDLDVHVAVIYGTANVRKLLDTPDWKDKYQFIEVMTCPGGCIGGGQPLKKDEEGDNPIRARIDSLYKRDASLPGSSRTSDQNREIIQLYKEFYGKPLSESARKMLHTGYEDKSASIGEPVEKYQSYRKAANPGFTTNGQPVTNTPAPSGKVKKWVCDICGYVYEGEEPPAECPLCHMDASHFHEVKEEPEEKPIKKWKCDICGYVYEGTEPPAECPICHKDASHFVEVKDKPAEEKPVKKWKCVVCGYIYEGTEPPAECPICHKDASYFVEVKDEPAEEKPIKKWKCDICGYVYEGTEPPAVCPLCHMDASHFHEVD